MLKPRARWNIQEAAPDAVDTLTRELGIDRLLARLLIVRGIREADEADRFLHKEKASFYDPYLMDGMDHAVRRIRAALGGGEKIRIYGDYDADGVSSTSLMIYVMRRLQANFDYYIPHRVHEGYGLNQAALDHAKRNGVSLIVTVDTGISARAEIAYAAELGLDVIVTDHHEPPEELPEAYAILNPKKPGCPYPFKQLAGVGVAFKLAHALFDEAPEELLEMAAIGTVADLMPLIDENRQIVRIGIERMRRTSNVGIKALLGLAGVEIRDVSATHIGFALAPRINASGRLDCADDAVKLLTTTSEQEAEHLAYALDQLNKERQRIVEEIAQEAFTLAEEQKGRRVLVLAQDEWNVGVIGIVASKIMDRFYSPTIVLSIDPQTGMAKGSARSIPGFDIYKAISHCGDLLDHYGGHQAAAGMSLHKDRIAEFQSRLQALAEEWLTEEDLVPVLQADLMCSLDEVPLETIKQLDRLAPFGMGNPAPRFVFSGLKVGEMRTMGKEQQHIKLSLTGQPQQLTASIEAVAFGRGAWMQQISATASVDVLGELSVNEWNGVRKPQIVVHDLCVPEPQLFDWRGIGIFDMEKRWGKLTERFIAGGPDQSGRPAVVLFEEIELSQLPSSIAMSGCSIWRFDPKAGFIPVHRDRLDMISESLDFLFYSLPRSLNGLEQALSVIPGAQRLYAKFLPPESLETAVPTRDMFKYAYTAIKQQGSLDVGNDKMLEAFSSRSGLSKASLAFIMEVFEELEFTVREGNVYRCLTTPAKRELTSSEAYQAGLLRQEAERLLIYSSAGELTSWMLSRISGGTNGGKK